MSRVLYVAGRADIGRIGAANRPAPRTKLQLDSSGNFTVVVGVAEPSHEEEFNPTADELVSGNRRFAETFDSHLLEVSPTRHMAIVTCMDSRMDIFALLGLGNGEAHIIRNAGGVITDDVVRSLCLSQRYLGTREVVLVHHTDCGLQLVTEDGLKAEIEAETGIKPWWAVESFDDPYVDVRQSMKRLEMTPFVPFKGNVRGFVYDVQTGLLEEVFLSDDDAEDPAPGSVDDG